MTARPDDIYDRIRFMESEMAEKISTHSVLEVMRRNGENILGMNRDIIAMNMLVSRMAGDIVLMQAAQPGQRERLNALARDVREMRTKLEAVEQDVTTGFDRIDTRLDAIERAIAAVHAAAAPREPQA
jgi:hypothetical protein